MFWASNKVLPTFKEYNQMIDRAKRKILCIEGRNGGKIGRVYPSGRSSMKCNLPELHMLDQELVWSLHVIQWPTCVLFPYVLHKNLKMSCVRYWILYYTLHKKLKLRNGSRRIQSMKYPLHLKPRNRQEKERQGMISKPLPIWISE